MPANLFDNPTSPPDDSPGAVFSGGLLTEDTSTGSHYLLVYGSAVTSGNTYTFSVEAKANGRTWLAIQPQPTGFPAREAYFDLSGGAVGTVDSELVAARIEDLGSGWYRCSATIIATGSPSSLSCAFVLCEADNDFTYTGDGASGVYLQNFVAIAPALSVGVSSVDVVRHSVRYDPRTPDTVRNFRGSCLSAVVTARGYRRVWDFETPLMDTITAASFEADISTGDLFTLTGYLVGSAVVTAAIVDIQRKDSPLYSSFTFTAEESL